MSGHPGYTAILDELAALHREKSGGYGRPDDAFANFTAVGLISRQPRFAYPVCRMVEKLSRCLSLLEQGRCGELGEEFLDVASLAVCAEAMRREDEETADVAVVDAS